MCVHFCPFQSSRFMTREVDTLNEIRTLEGVELHAMLSHLKLVSSLTLMLDREGPLFCWQRFGVFSELFNYSQSFSCPTCDKHILIKLYFISLSSPFDTPCINCCQFLIHITKPKEIKLRHLIFLSKLIPSFL